jgi:hypothetical protein
LRSDGRIKFVKTASAGVSRPRAVTLETSERHPRLADARRARGGGIGWVHGGISVSVLERYC